MFVFAGFCLVTAVVICQPVVTGETHTGDVYDVIILGGGLAGVSAARTLVKEGVTNFIMIEGRHEVGGRMQSTSFGDYTVELGASWTQGVKDNTDNPMYKEVIHYNLTRVQSEWTDVLYYNETGDDVTAEALPECAVLEHASDRRSEYRDTIQSDPERGDISVRAALRWFGFDPKTPVQMSCDFFVNDFLYGEEPSQISTFYLDTTYEDFGDDDLLIIDSRGYSTIPKAILADNVPDWQDKVHLETVVTSVNYSDSGVVITTDKGTFTGKQALVTFSIGVLQSSAVQFFPVLPEWKQEAIQAFLIADYVHIYMKFDESIDWFVPGNSEWISHASSRRGYFPLWQNYNKHLPGSHILEAIASGNEARRLQTQTDSQVLADAMSVLRTMFGADIPDAEQISVFRFSVDPLFQGSYSSWPLGFTGRQHEALQAPVGPVYFAGDAYSRKYTGYTHGAMLSGEKTAREIANCLRNAKLCSKPYIPAYTAKGCMYKLAINYDPLAQIDDGSCMLVTKAPISSGTIGRFQLPGLVVAVTLAAIVSAVGLQW